MLRVNYWPFFPLFCCWYIKRNEIVIILFKLNSLFAPNQATSQTVFHRVHKHKSVAHNGQWLRVLRRKTYKLNCNIPFRLKATEWKMFVDCVHSIVWYRHWPIASIRKILLCMCIYKKNGSRKYVIQITISQLKIQEMFRAFIFLTLFMGCVRWHLPLYTKCVRLQHHFQLFQFFN